MHREKTGGKESEYGRGDGGGTGSNTAAANHPSPQIA